MKLKRVCDRVQYGVLQHIKDFMNSIILYISRSNWRAIHIKLIVMIYFKLLIYHHICTLMMYIIGLQHVISNNVAF